MLLYFLIIEIIAVIGVDQLTKYLVATRIPLDGSVPVIDGVLNFTYIRNEGAALGMLSDSRWVFLILSTLSILALSVYLFARYKKLNRHTCYFWGLIIGGGIGNMLDRIFGAGKYDTRSVIERVIDGSLFDNMFGGAVVDFVDPSFYKWTFNFADACVNVGVWCFAAFVIYNEIAAYRKAKKMAKIDTLTPEDTGKSE